MCTSLKGSKTHQNLKEAFAGESQANRRYWYFANKADVEGHTDVAALFRATMLIEYADEQERRVALTKLKGIERKTWVQVEGAKKSLRDCRRRPRARKRNQDFLGAFHALSAQRRDGCGIEVRRHAQNRR